MLKLRKENLKLNNITQGFKITHNREFCDAEITRGKCIRFGYSKQTNPVISSCAQTALKSLNHLLTCSLVHSLTQSKQVRVIPDKTCMFSAFTPSPVGRGIAVGAAIASLTDMGEGTIAETIGSNPQRTRKHRQTPLPRFLFPRCGKVYAQTALKPLNHLITCSLSHFKISTAKLHPLASDPNIFTPEVNDGKH